MGVAAIALVDMDALRRDAGEPLQLGQQGCQSVAVKKMAVPGLGVQQNARKGGTIPCIPAETSPCRVPIAVAPLGPRSSSRTASPQHKIKSAYQSAEAGPLLADWLPRTDPSLEAASTHQTPWRPAGGIQSHGFAGIARLTQLAVARDPCCRFRFPSHQYGHQLRMWPEQAGNS